MARLDWFYIFHGSPESTNRKILLYKILSRTYDLHRLLEVKLS
jgi:hypothetical protein